jgi:hypothetical protein
MGRPTRVDPDEVAIELARYSSFVKRHQDKIEAQNEYQKTVESKMLTREGKRAIQELHTQMIMCMGRELQAEKDSHEEAMRRINPDFCIIPKC